jgi:pimeloyl-ACP methyl ester carboxylesterase
MPGSLLAGKMFGQVAQEQQTRIHVADRPGYTTSSPVRHGTLLGYVADVSALVDALQVDTFAVLGVSGGAPFALACAAKIPERKLLARQGPLSSCVQG